MRDPRPLAVVILTRDEEGNLPDCLASLRRLDAEVFVVDSGSTDRTREIAGEAGCHVVQHPFEDYAAQRNWALENLPVRSPWILNMDADERLTAALAEEIAVVVTDPDAPYVGYMMSRRTVFLGRWLRHGGQYPAWHLRLCRAGRVRCERRRYDQHFVVDGNTGRLRNDLIDVLSTDLTRWTERHNRWASLEAEELYAKRRNRRNGGDGVRPRFAGTPIERRRFLREGIYERFPPLLRPFLFFVYSYVLRLGFLDGVPGLVFHALQRFWFRFLVDAKLLELEYRARHDGEKS
jgi:glycosyltransferase involved in cell wall biosynthesis